MIKGLKKVRDYYNIPAYRGSIIYFCHMKAKILSSDGQYLFVQITKEGKKLRIKIHPTWNVLYKTGRREK